MKSSVETCDECGEVKSRSEFYGLREDMICRSCMQKNRQKRMHHSQSLPYWLKPDMAHGLRHVDATTRIYKEGKTPKYNHF